MGWMQFVNAILGHLFSWPVFGVVAVVVFRRQLALLIHRVTSYEGLGQKFTFGQELAKVEEQAEALVASQARGLPPQADDQPADTEDDRFSVLATQAPAGVILEAWLHVEKAVVALAEIYDITDPTQNRSQYISGTRPFRPHPARLIGGLAERQLIPMAVVRVIEGLRRLRNEVAHGAHEPTTGEAITYAITAREVWEIMERLMSLAIKANGNNTGDEGESAA